MNPVPAGIYGQRVINDNQSSVPREFLAMPRRIASATLLLLLAPAALAAPVRRAGEWQTIIDGGTPLMSCVSSDKEFNKDAVLQQMAQMPNVTCQMNQWDPSGDSITYSLQCSFQGNQITTSGTMTQTGSDEFTTKSHTSAFSMTIDGKTMAMPASDMTIVARRLGGTCQPTDRKVD
jgi:hypothetical protein